jgi:dihydrofolate reductase
MLIVTNIMSLDGYVAGPDGNPMALPMDARFDRYNADRLTAASTLLLGATTYSMLHSFWPYVADDASATPVNREISRLNGAIDKVVVSDSLPSSPPGPWQSTTTVVRRAAAHAEVAALRQRGDIVVFGSRTLWNDLLTAGLVDEIHLLVGAVVLGEGIPAFDAGPDLDLLSTHTWTDSSNVLLRYAASPGTKPRLSTSA